MNNPVTYDNSNDTLLTAVDEAMWHVKEAMDELRGLGEYKEWFDALEDMYGGMETEKLRLDDYFTGEYQQMIADLTREWERERLW